MRRAGLRPVARIEGAAGRQHGTLHVLRVAVGDRTPHATVARADAVEAGAAGSVDLAAVDEGLAGYRQLECQRLPVAAVGEIGHGILLQSTSLAYTGAAATSP
ncbi:hypothetical protein G6F50_016371 [Rhizopus delemar]|uniref:Uncharacterized protein n=1 Tax=Rhizopus delemar TaxID=936053 RepID=A0A9P6XT92_9FUNG|nr:hypothetical protein G6F50_016371 [Rhizopus delemar]